MKRLIVGLCVVSLFALAVSCGGPEKPVATEKKASETEKATPQPPAPEKQTTAPEQKKETPPAPKKEAASPKKQEPVKKPEPPRPVIGSNDLVRNGSFEELTKEARPGIWNIAKEYADFVSIDKKTAYEGKNSLCATFKEAKRIVVVQGIDVPPGGKVSCTALAKTEGTGGVRLEAIAPGAKQPFAVSPMVHDAAEWTPMKAELSCPPNVERVTLAIALVAKESTGGTVWVDNCEAYALKPPVAGNILINGDFAKEGAGWDPKSLAEGVKQSFAKEGPAAGKACMQLEVPAKTASGNLIMNHSFTKRPEAKKTYLLQGFLKSQDLPGEACLRVSAFGEKGHLNSYPTKMLTGTQGWTPVSVVFTLPEGTAWVGVKVDWKAAEAEKKDSGKKSDKSKKSDDKKSADVKPGLVWVGDCQVYELPSK